MASYQQADYNDMNQGGVGPEYEYPTTEKDEEIPVVAPSMEDAELTADDPAQAPGEDAEPLDDDELAREEELEDAEAGEWSEDMAENEPRPGEEDEYDPDMERLPSDRG